MVINGQDSCHIMSMSLWLQLFLCTFSCIYLFQNSCECQLTLTEAEFEVHFRQYLQEIGIKHLDCLTCILRSFLYCVIKKVSLLIRCINLWYCWKKDKWVEHGAAARLPTMWGLLQPIGIGRYWWNRANCNGQVEINYELIAKTILRIQKLIYREFWMD